MKIIFILVKQNILTTVTNLIKNELFVNMSLGTFLSFY